MGIELCTMEEEETKILINTIRQFIIIEHRKTAFSTLCKQTCHFNDLFLAGIIIIFQCGV